MADNETKENAEKSKRIEAERMKAARALAESTEDKANLAFLEPTKTKGFSRDYGAILKSMERVSNASIIFVVLGIVFGIFQVVAAMVSAANNLGLAGGALIMVISAINYIGLGAGFLMAIVSLVSALIFARKTHYRIKPIVITSICSIGLVLVYFLIRFSIMNSA